jgi:uncharacterized protein YecT (DUF1311 family)
MFRSRRCSNLSLLVVCLLVFLPALAASGHSQTTKTKEKSCGDYDTQAQMNECAARQANEADAALNAVYRELLNKLKDNKTATAKIVAAQNAWVTFRDAELAADWPVGKDENPNAHYGSVHPFCFYEELASMTLERVRKLRAYLHPEEGDVCAYGP